MDKRLYAGESKENYEMLDALVDVVDRMVVQVFVNKNASPNSVYAEQDVKYQLGVVGSKFNTTPTYLYNDPDVIKEFGNFGFSDGNYLFVNGDFFRGLLEQQKKDIALVTNKKNIKTLFGHKNVDDKVTAVFYSMMQSVLEKDRDFADIYAEVCDNPNVNCRLADEQYLNVAKVEMVSSERIKEVFNLAGLSTVTEKIYSSLKGDEQEIENSILFKINSRGLGSDLHLLGDVDPSVYQNFKNNISPIVYDFLDKNDIAIIEKNLSVFSDDYAKRASLEALVINDVILDYVKERNFTVHSPDFQGVMDTIMEYGGRLTQEKFADFLRKAGAEIVNSSLVEDKTENKSNNKILFTQAVSKSPLFTVEARKTLLDEVSNYSKLVFSDLANDVPLRVKNKM